MNKTKLLSLALLVLMVAAMLAVPTLAAAEDAPVAESEVQTAEEDDGVGLKAVGAGIAIGLAAAGGGLGMGIVGGKAADGISRQPEMEGKIRTTMMLNLVFIETAIIYALLAVILIIFVL